VGLLTPASHYFHGVIAAIRQRHPAAARLAVVHTTAGTFATEVACGAQQYGQQHGFAAVRSYQYPAETRDFMPLLHQIGQDNSEVLLGVGRMEDDIRLAVQLRQAGLPLTAVGLIATPMAVFRDTLGPAADGFLGPSQWEPGLVRRPGYGPTPQEVIASLQARASGGIDYPMAQAYAGGLVAQRCIELAGSLAPAALRQAANALDFTTFYGRFRIDPATGRQQGHIMPVIQWQQGRKVIIWP
jgi:branched-chain amino acid transport system substrate-binding protein